MMTQRSESERDCSCCTTGRKSPEAGKGEETGSPQRLQRRQHGQHVYFARKGLFSLLIFTAVGWYIFAVSSHKICGHLLQCQRKQTLPGANIFSQMVYGFKWCMKQPPWDHEDRNLWKNQDNILRSDEQAMESACNHPWELLPLDCMWCKIMYGCTFCNLWPKKKNPSCTIILSCSQPTSALQSHLVMLSQFSHRLGSCRCAQLCPTLCSPMD